MITASGLVTKEAASTAAASGRTPLLFRLPVVTSLKLKNLGGYPGWLVVLAAAAFLLGSVSAVTEKKDGDLIRVYAADLDRTEASEGLLEELRQKQPHSGKLEIKGCALDLVRISEFLERLKREEAFSVIRLVESGTRPIESKDREDNGKTVISFLLLAEFAPAQAEEERP